MGKELWQKGVVQTSHILPGDPRWLWKSRVRIWDQVLTTSMVKHCRQSGSVYATHFPSQYNSTLQFLPSHPDCSLSSFFLSLFSPTTACSPRLHSLIICNNMRWLLVITVTFSARLRVHRGRYRRGRWCNSPTGICFQKTMQILIGVWTRNVCPISSHPPAMWDRSWLKDRLLAERAAILSPLLPRNRDGEQMLLIQIKMSCRSYIIKLTQCAPKPRLALRELLHFHTSTNTFKATPKQITSQRQRDHLLLAGWQNTSPKLNQSSQLFPQTYILIKWYR